MSFRKGLVPADEARAIVLESALPLGSETVPVSRAAGRILAGDLAALRTQPPFAASAMDGYALNSKSVDTAQPFNLRLIGEAAAGHPFVGDVNTGEAVRIFTGAPVPKGADTIAIQENVEPLDDGQVLILKPEPPGKYIRKAGLDFETGDVLLNAGMVMGPARSALAAAMNHAEVPVVRRPKIALIATGDELVQPGSALKPGQIIASNTYGLAAMLRTLGADVLDMGISRDTPTALEETVNKATAERADILVTMGGASVGDHDLVFPTLERLGFAFRFTKIAMRPGKPFLFATRESTEYKTYLLGLAGNPVSSLVAAHVFLKPLVQTLAGAPVEAIQPLNGILGCPLPQNDEREEYMRASISHEDDGTRIITPFDSQDSSQLANLARADCLMIRPRLAPPAVAGDPCTYIPF